MAALESLGKTLKMYALYLFRVLGNVFPEIKVNEQWYTKVQQGPVEFKRILYVGVSQEVHQLLSSFSLA